MNKLVAAIPAMRPAFLILAPICVSLAASLASFNGFEINELHLSLAILGSILAAIAVNTLNEYQDNQSGLDLTTQKTPFSGGSGLLEKQPELKKTVLNIAIGSSLTVFLIGCYFSYIIGTDIVIIGLLGLAIIWLYTKYLNKLAWVCLISPGFGFGLLMVIGSYYVLTGQIDTIAWQAALVPFLLVNNLLLLNQYPDIDADKAVGRSHFAICYGIKAANSMFLTNIILSIAVVIFIQIEHQLSWLVWLSLLPIALSLISFRGMLTFGKNIANSPKHMALNVACANLTPIVLTLAIASS